MNKKILIFGAGAIGRGYLAPLLYQNGFHSIDFVDINKQLIKKLKNKKYYFAAITEKFKYKTLKIPINKVFHLSEKINIKKYEIVFSCVGPKNCLSLNKIFREAKCVISCENDITTVEKLKKLSGNKKIYFGIPDVITSSSPPQFLKKKYDLNLTITEKGELILEKGQYALPKKIKQVNKENLNMHWRCKLFIHNAAHAITAYLGHLNNKKYIHEAMQNPKISKVVHGSINEITEGVINAEYASKKFANYYKRKELKRFKNKLLFDTIGRVAREPIRKLSKDNRIVLGLKICLFNKKLPRNVALGAKAALYYNNKKDVEALTLMNMRKKYGDKQTLENICSIEKLDPLNNFIVKQNLEIFKNGR
tara:strand:- start:695 stop:1786 length:1092 start_codon:yes stop_codon:yes gene_type:complete